MNNIKLKRVYDEISDDDGFRILVDRLWPRGVKKSDAGINMWLKDVAPSDNLRKWFKHDRGKWEKFRQLYIEELEDKKNRIEEVIESVNDDTITLVFAAKDRQYNQAVVLKEFIEDKLM